MRQAFLHAAVIINALMKLFVLISKLKECSRLRMFLEVINFQGFCSLELFLQKKRVSSNVGLRTFFVYLKS